MCGLSLLEVVSCLCSEAFFLGSPVFLPRQKPTFPNKFDQKSVDKKPLCGDATAKCQFIYLF